MAPSLDSLITYYVNFQKILIRFAIKFANKLDPDHFGPDLDPSV